MTLEFNLDFNYSESHKGQTRPFLLSFNTILNPSFAHLGQS